MATTKKKEGLVEKVKKKITAGKKQVMDTACSAMGGRKKSPSSATKSVTKKAAAKKAGTSKASAKKK